MYIHTYQIHNVLNAYRNHLIGDPIEPFEEDAAPATAAPSERAQICRSDQRKVIIEQVSADIVDRLTRQGTRHAVEDALWGYIAQESQRDLSDEFTYTCIDENNRKVTGIFEIQRLKAAVGGMVAPAARED